MDQDLIRKLYQAVKIWDWEFIDKYVENGGDINVSLVNSGPQAGYTVLHFAVSTSDWYAKHRENVHSDAAYDFIIEKKYYIKKLITEYRANVNVIAADGAQPIHLACFNRRFNYDCIFEIVEDLLEAGADANAEITKELFDKYKYDGRDTYECGEMKWSDDFGGKMSLLIFSIFRADSTLGNLVLKYKANVNYKGAKNKTLLMYNFEIDHRKIEFLIYSMQNYPELMNARDDDGFHIVHYLLPYKDFEGYQYDRRLRDDCYLASCVSDLIYCQADINSMINNDPNSLLINMAAQRCYFYVLKVLMKPTAPCFCLEAEPLLYVLLPVDREKYDATEFYNDVEDENERRYHEAVTNNYAFREDKTLEKRKQECLEYIVQNYVMRREFGWFVPEKEMKLMDLLVATNSEIKTNVKKFQDNYIDKIKKQVIHYGDKCVTVYNVVPILTNRVALKRFINNKQLVEKYLEFHYKVLVHEEDPQSLRSLIWSKIRYAEKQEKLMEKIQKISKLRQALPLPYEIVLLILEYLYNEDLEEFIAAFYC